MYKQIEEKDLVDIIGKFEKYTETAEQHEFSILAMIQFGIQKTDVSEIVKDQEEAKAMYRAIAKTIGEDYSEFEEPKDGQ